MIQLFYWLTTCGTAEIACVLYAQKFMGIMEQFTFQIILRQKVVVFIKGEMHNGVSPGWPSG